MSLNKDERQIDPSLHLEHEIDPDVERKLLAYPGKWAAITPSEVVATGDDPATVLAAARAKGIDAPILYHVPDGSSIYFL